MSKLKLQIDQFTESLVKLNLVPTVEATWLEGYKPLPNISRKNDHFPEDIDVYKKCVVLCFYDKLVGGGINESYKDQVNNFKEFLISKGVKYDISEKYNNNLSCNTARIKLNRTQLEII
jgi:hypothetical protein